MNWFDKSEQIVLHESLDEAAIKDLEARGELSKIFKSVNGSAMLRLEGRPMLVGSAKEPKEWTVESEAESLLSSIIANGWHLLDFNSLAAVLETCVKTNAATHERIYGPGSMAINYYLIKSELDGEEEIEDESAEGSGKQLVELEPAR